MAYNILRKLKMHVFVYLEGRLPRPFDGSRQTGDVRDVWALDCVIALARVSNTMAL